jgi:hypothetical protein
LFYINVKGNFNYTYVNTYVYVWLFFLFFFILLVNFYSESDSNFDLNLYGLIDNYYESIFNQITNDLFGFSLSYYLINGIEFLFIGFLLLVGSVVCVNLYQMNKNIRTQSYNSYLSVFNFFNDFTSFFFLRRQNLIKQGNVKASLKLFKKK